jgi:uncharacterized protein (TIGR03086 family)
MTTQTGQTGPNTGPADLFRRAASHTRAAVAGVDASQMGDETPCADWTVEELLNHIIGGASLGAVAFGAAAPEADSALGAYDGATEAAVKAMNVDGAMERMVTGAGGGEMPGGYFATLLSMDNLVHGWDLAKATGQSTELPEDLVEIMYADFETQMDRFRQGDNFGPEVTQPDNAPTQDKLIGMMGRAP